MGQVRDPFPAAAEFGGRVRSRRHALGWSLERLDEEVGMHWTYCAQVELGKRNPSLRSIIRIAKALDIDAGALVEGLRP